LDRYFFGPGERFFDGDTDAALLRGKGKNGTGHLEQGKGRVDVDLNLWGHPDFGALLFYSEWDGKHGVAFASKGDLRRLGEWVEGYDEDLRSIGLFISLEQAWRAVTEFIEMDGALPRSIEWIPADDLPPHAFPEPGSVPMDHPKIHRRD
jgi:hypothetical protein